MTNAATSAAGGSHGDMLQALLSESQRLGDDVRERGRRQRNTNILMASGIAVALIMLIALMILLVQGRQRGADTRALIRSGNSTADQIADCTTVGRPCYEQSRKQTAEVMRQLIAAQVDIQNCADKTSTEAELRACVAKALDPGPTAGVGPSPKETP